MRIPGPCSQFAAVEAHTAHQSIDTLAAGSKISRGEKHSLA